MKPRYLIGIDEVGRGPLAGPVAVCALVLKISGKKTLPKTLKRKTFDSKQISPAEREVWYKKICLERDAGTLDFCVTFISAKIIDTKGLSFAIRSALEKSLATVVGRANNPKKIKPTNFQILLDGGLKAPAEFINQKTIIKGDAKEAVIGLASIAAKVTRDRLMTRLAKKYPHYDLATHKGYGTRAHIKAIRQHGPSPIHRRSFLAKISP